MWGGGVGMGWSRFQERCFSIYQKWEDVVKRELRPQQKYSMFFHVLPTLKKLAPSKLFSHQKNDQPIVFWSKVYFKYRKKNQNTYLPTGISLQFHNVFAHENNVLLTYGLLSENISLIVLWCRRDAAKYIRCLVTI